MHFTGCVDLTDDVIRGPAGCGCKRQPLRGCDSLAVLELGAAHSARDRTRSPPVHRLGAASAVRRHRPSFSFYHLYRLDASRNAFSATGLSGA